MNLNFNKYKERSTWVAPIGAFVTFFLGAILGTVIQDWYITKSITNPMFIWFIIVLMLALLIAFFLELYQLMYRLYNKVGIKVRYVENDEFGKIYQACNKILERATRSVYVVNSYIYESHEPRGTKKQQEIVNAEREKYYNILMKKSKEQNIDYVRIVQTSPNGEPLADAFEDALLFDHLAAMNACMDGETNISTVTLLKAPATRLNTYIIVDGKTLIWQVNEVKFDETSPNGRLNLQGAFIFHDPQTKIIEQFLKFFDKLRNQANGRILLRNNRII